MKNKKPKACFTADKHNAVNKSNRCTETPEKVGDGIHSL